MTTKPRTTARKRAGRCYELSFRSLFEMDNPGNWCLVHGTVAKDNPHAWLTDGEVVFDPIHSLLKPSVPSFTAIGVAAIANTGWKGCADLYESVDAYRRLANARAVATYTKSEAVAKVAATGHYGPWHDH